MTTKSKEKVRVIVSVADVHREPAHESELTSQAGMGTLLEILDTADEGRWLHVRLPDAYVGWVRSWLAGPVRRGWPGPDAVEVDAPFTWIRSAAARDADPVSDVTIGTRLARRGRSRSGWAGVILPDGREGFIETADLLRGGRPENGTGRRPRKVQAILATARRFLGVPYVWGGRSPKGLDCSGLTQMVFELHDVEIPRDSKDQRTFLENRNGAIHDPLAVPPGGLVFFGKNPDRASHVGISLGGGLFIHAQGRVRIQSLDPDNEQFHKDLASLFQVGSKVSRSLV